MFINQPKRNMDSGEIAALVAIVGMLFQYLGITSIDSNTITGVVNALVTLVAFGAALWSWWIHRTTSTAN